jgi:hypothetical protein
MMQSLASGSAKPRGVAYASGGYGRYPAGAEHRIAVRIKERGRVLFSLFPARLMEDLHPYALSRRLSS